MEEINNEKLQRFSLAVNTEIDHQVDEIIREAEKKSRTIIEEANARSAETADKYYAENIKKVSGKYLREASRLELEAKKEVLRRREELTGQVFDAVSKRLAQYRTSADYAIYMKKLLAEAAPAAGDVVYIGEEDEKLSELLKKDYAEVEFKTDEHIHLGGLSVYSKKNGTISDRTFDFALEEQRKEFAGRNSFA